MRKSFLAGAAGATLLAVLAGCGGQTTVVQPTFRTSYDPAMLMYAAKQGGVKVDILGAPFAGREAAVSQTVTSRLAQSVPGVDMPFFTEPPEGFESPFRVVMLFDPAPGTDYQHLCTAPGKGAGDAAATGSERLRVAAALCSTNQTITRVRGSVSNVRSPEDDGFADLVGQLGRGLFLPTNPDMNNGGGDFDA